MVAPNPLAPTTLSHPAGDDGDMSYARYDAVADFRAAGFDSTDDPVSRELSGLPGQVTGLRVLNALGAHGLSIDRLAEPLPDPEGTLPTRPTARPSTSSPAR
jgi:hypothetical protein